MFIFCAMKPEQIIRAAVQAVTPKTQARLAQLLGVEPMTIRQWKRRGVPPERCIEVERAVGGKVTRYELRPDVFGERPGLGTGDSGPGERREERL
jgi:DNA-binding transcriptional regulator YdaS (Cro superfamily)